MVQYKAANPDEICSLTSHETVRHHDVDWVSHTYNKKKLLLSHKK